MQRFHLYASVVVLAMAGWAVLTGVVKPMAAGLRISEDFSEVPKEAGIWKGFDDKIDEVGYNVLSTCSFLNRQYTDGLGNGVNLSIVYGRDLGDFHKPEICMGGAGWRTTGRQFVTLHPKGAKPHLATVVRLQDDYYEELVMVYWFWMNGEVAPTMGKTKTLAILNALRTQELPPSAMVKFSAMVVSDEETARKQAIALSEQLESSILEVVRKQPKMIPSDTPLEQPETAVTR